MWRVLDLTAVAPIEGLKVLEVFVDNMVGYSALCDAQSIDNPTLVALRLRRLVPKRIRRFTELFGQCRWPPDIEQLREHGGMKDFSHFVLESTLELAVKAMPHDVRVGKCVEAIRRCLDSSPDPEHDDELRSAVTVLLEIALQQHQFLIQFLIAARFLEIARQLGRR